MMELYDSSSANGAGDTPATPEPSSMLCHGFIFIPAKKSDPVQFETNACAWIAERYGHGAAQAVYEPLRQMSLARANFLAATGDGRSCTAESLVQQAGTYLQYLQAFMQRFTYMGPRGMQDTGVFARQLLVAGGGAGSVVPGQRDEITLLDQLQLKWSHCFNVSQVTPITNLRIEKACVLFNLAALISRHAAQLSREHAAGSMPLQEVLRQQCREFRIAASMLQRLSEYVSEQLANVIRAHRDLTPENLAWFRNLLLSHAQETCYYMARNPAPGVPLMSHSALAQLAQQCAVNYAEAVPAAPSDDLSRMALETLQIGAADVREQLNLTKVPDYWLSYCYIMSAYFSAMAIWHHCKQLYLDDPDSSGHRVGYMSRAVMVLENERRRTQAFLKQRAKQWAAETGLEQELMKAARGAPINLQTVLARAAQNDMTSRAVIDLANFLTQEHSVFAGIMKQEAIDNETIYLSSAVIDRQTIDALSIVPRNMVDKPIETYHWLFQDVIVFPNTAAGQVDAQFRDARAAGGAAREAHQDVMRSPAPVRNLNVDAFDAVLASDMSGAMLKFAAKKQQMCQKAQEETQNANAAFWSFVECNPEAMLCAVLHAKKSLGQEFPSTFVGSAVVELQVDQTYTQTMALAEKQLPDLSVRNGLLLKECCDYLGLKMGSPETPSLPPATLPMIQASFENLHSLCIHYCRSISQSRDLDQLLQSTARDTAPIWSYLRSAPMEQIASDMLTEAEQKLMSLFDPLLEDTQQDEALLKTLTGVPKRALFSRIDLGAGITKLMTTTKQMRDHSYDQMHSIDDGDQARKQLEEVVRVYNAQTKNKGGKLAMTLDQAMDRKLNEFFETRYGQFLAQIRQTNAEQTEVQKRWLTETYNQPAIRPRSTVTPGKPKLPRGYHTDNLVLFYREATSYSRVKSRLQMAVHFHTAIYEKIASLKAQCIEWRKSYDAGAPKPPPSHHTNGTTRPVAPIPTSVSFVAQQPQLAMAAVEPAVTPVAPYNEPRGPSLVEAAFSTSSDDKWKQS